jgi:hypothetical protein
MTARGRPLTIAGMKLLWIAALLLVPRIAAPADAAEAQKGVTAIGDVHGDFETFRTLLRRAELIDEQDRWSGGQRHLVQTGDFLDRGAGSRRVMDLLMRLEGEARAAGGRVKVLLGNHEVMNIVGDLVCTSYGEFGAYQEDEVPAERARRKEKVLRFLKDGSPLLLSSYTRECYRYLNEQTFDRFFPPGFFAHRAALLPSGRYGRWLIEHDIIHKEERTIFLHGGLSARFGSVPIDDLNRAAKAELKRHLDAVGELERLGAFDEALGFRELRWMMQEERRAGGPHPKLAKVFADIDAAWNSLLFSEDGPLWYRGLAEGDERTLSRTVERTLRAQDASAIVIGHTQPQSLRVETRFQGRVVLIDTGMNQAVYHGRPSAVSIRPTGEMTVLE